MISRVIRSSLGYPRPSSLPLDHQLPPLSECILEVTEQFAARCPNLSTTLHLKKLVLDGFLFRPI